MKRTFLLLVMLAGSLSLPVGAQDHAPAPPALIPQELMQQTQAASQEMKELLHDLMNVSMQPAAAREGLKSALSVRLKEFDLRYTLLFASLPPPSSTESFLRLREAALAEPPTLVPSAEEIESRRLKLDQLHLRVATARNRFVPRTDGSVDIASEIWERELRLALTSEALEAGTLLALMRKAAIQERSEVASRWQQEAPRLREEIRRLTQERSFVSSQPEDPEKFLRESLLEEQSRMAEATLDGYALRSQLAEVEERLSTPPVEETWKNHNLVMMKNRLQTITQERDIIQARKKIYQSRQDELKSQTVLSTANAPVSLSNALSLPPEIEARVAMTGDLLNLVSGEEMTIEKNRQRVERLIRSLEEVQVKIPETKATGPKLMPLLERWKDRLFKQSKPSSGS